MFGFGQVHAAEIALVEHRTFGAQPTQILVAEIVRDEFPLYPHLFVVVHRQLGSELATLSAYSVTSIRAARAELRSRASTETTGVRSDSASALRTA